MPQFTKLKTFVFAGLISLGGTAVSVPSSAEACGFKVVTVKMAPKLARARTPVRAPVVRPVVAAPKSRDVVAAGPAQAAPTRTLTDQKEPAVEPPPVVAAAPVQPAPTPTPEPEPAPAPAPEPTPAPEPAPEPAPAVAKKAAGLKGEVYFGVGNADLDQSSTTKLEKLAERIKADPDAYVVVSGHTDASGSAAINMELSERRANAVKDALIGMGVDSSKIEAEGFGSQKSAYPDARRNRRAAIVVKKK